MKKILIMLILTFAVISSQAQNTTGYKIKNEYLTEQKWKSLKRIIIYNNQNFTKSTGFLNKGEIFEILDSEYTFYDMMNVRITKVLGHDFPDCENNNFKVGDTIKLLIGYGECFWAVLHNGRLKYCNYTFEYDDKKITRSIYDGCNLIEGRIIKDTENRVFTAKIRTNKGNIGWIKIQNNGKHISEWESIQSTY